MLCFLCVQQEVSRMVEVLGLGVLYFIPKDLILMEA